MHDEARVRLMIGRSTSCLAQTTNAAGVPRADPAALRTGDS
jgi:hypothetical protein